MGLARVGVQVLHYGMSCFEGMKAYKAADGSVRMFRPTKNMQRFAQSCHRLNLPSFDQVPTRLHFAPSCTLWMWLCVSEKDEA